MVRPGFGGCFGARFGRTSRNVVVALGYDTARAGIHGIANALIATRDQLKLGLELIKWVPCANGGPSTYITFAAYDQSDFKGDLLTIRDLRGGEFHLRGYYRPTWPSRGCRCCWKAGHVSGGSSRLWPGWGRVALDDG